MTRIDGRPVPRFQGAAAMLAFVATMCACAGQSPDTRGSGPAGRPCTSSADCGGASTFQCLYPVAEACGATGVCEAVTVNPGCSAGLESNLCGCDGTVTSGCGLPTDFADRPIAHPGLCAAPDAGPDAGPDAKIDPGEAGGEGDADLTGTPCSSNADCGGGSFSCLYPIQGGCSATRACLRVDPSAGSCIAIALCGRDGSAFAAELCNTSGTDKAVAYFGFCDAGSSD